MWFSGKESACQCRRHWFVWFDPWVGKIPLEEGMTTHCSYCPETHKQRSLAGYSPWDHKSRTQLSDSITTSPRDSRSRGVPGQPRPRTLLSWVWPQPRVELYRKCPVLPEVAKPGEAFPLGVAGRGLEGTPCLSLCCGSGQTAAFLIPNRALCSRRGRRVWKPQIERKTGPRVLLRSSRLGVGALLL